MSNLKVINNSGELEEIHLGGTTSAKELLIRSTIEALIAAINEKDYVLFNTSPSETSEAQGSMAWDTDELTLSLIQNGTILQVGQETQYNVRNNSGSEILDGVPVMATGTIGASGRITIGPMDGTDVDNAKLFLGLTTEDIANGEDGKVTHFGKVRGIDMSTFDDGDILYISSTVAGELVNVQPSSPAMAMAVAFVVNAEVNGTLFVRVNNLDSNKSIAYTDSKVGTIQTYEGVNSDRTLVTLGANEVIYTVEVVSDANWDSAQVINVKSGLNGLFSSPLVVSSYKGSIPASGDGQTTLGGDVTITCSDWGTGTITIILTIKDVS